jgi:hypothetical protein
MFARRFGGRRLAAALAAAAMFSSAGAARAASGPRFGSRTLQLGMSGHDVMWLQRNLTRVGIPTRVTAYFNAVTKRHVEAFQRRYNLSADGVAGPQTFSDMLAVLNHHSLRSTARSSSASTTRTAFGTPGYVAPAASAPVEDATLNSQGLAQAPADAPDQLKQVIAAANEIAFKPYVYGGGHGSWYSAGYDCSGSVSFALHGGGLASRTRDSTEFESYGSPGVGRWITIWANAGHAFMQIAGLWFDTAAQSSSNGNDRWSTTRVSPTGEGWTIVHPTGW